MTYYYLRSRKQPNGKARFRQKEAGQIVVEYALMLIVAVALATLIVNLVVSRRQGSEGFVIQKWQDIITAISADHPDDNK